MESEVVQLPLSDRLWAWFQDNQKRALWGLVLLAVAALVIWFLVSHGEEKRAEASAAFSDAFVTQLSGTRPDAVGAFQKVASAYPDFQGGANALLLAAGNLFAEGKYDEARAQFQKFTREHRNSPLVAEAMLGVAASLEAQNKTADAITAYTDLVQRYPGAVVVPRAKFALGRLYEAQNNPEQARRYFEEAAEADTTGTIGDEAGMRLQELLIKYPKLAPAAKAPAVSVPSTAPAPANKPATNAIAPKAGPAK